MLVKLPMRLHHLSGAPPRLLTLTATRLLRHTSNSTSGLPSHPSLPDLQCQCMIRLTCTDTTLRGTRRRVSMILSVCL